MEKKQLIAQLNVMALRLSKPGASMMDLNVALILSGIAMCLYYDQVPTLMAARQELDVDGIIYTF